MDCQKELRQCPNGWTDCTLCRYESPCRAGLYKPEELAEHELEVDLGIEIKEAEIKPEEQDGGKDGQRGSWYSKYIEMSEEERWEEYRRYKPPSLHDKEAIPLDGPSSPGGGGKCRVPKKPKKKMPEYLKTFGQ